MLDAAVALEVEDRLFVEDRIVEIAVRDLDDTVFNKETIFDFKRHRRIEHYGRITSQTGVTLPPK